MSGERAEVRLHDVSVRGPEVQAAVVVDAVRRALAGATAGPVDPATVEAALKRAIERR